METVFDHNLTEEEIEENGFLDRWLNVRHGLEFPEPYTEAGYKSTITAEGALFDLYLLFSYRRKRKKANTYAAQIPEKIAEFKLGFDYKVIPLKDSRQKNGPGEPPTRPKEKRVSSCFLPNPSGFDYLPDKSF